MLEKLRIKFKIHTPTHSHTVAGFQVQVLDHYFNLFVKKNGKNIAFHKNDFTTVKIAYINNSGMAAKKVFEYFSDILIYAQCDVCVHQLYYIIHIYCFVGSITKGYYLLFFTFAVVLFALTD